MADYDQRDQELLQEWIPSQQERMEQLVETWSNIDSSSTHIEGLLQMHAHLFKDCLPLAGRRYSRDLSSTHRLTPSGERVERQHPPALVVEQRLERPIRILVGGHFDTALPLTRSQPRCRRQGERLYGSGVCDMKGGIAVCLIALEALEQSSLAHAVGWDLLLTGDEELGSPASHSLWREYAWRNRLALLFEPALEGGELVSSRKGSLNFALFVQGQRAHAGRGADKGASAIDGLISFLYQFKRLIEEQGKGTISYNIGQIHGGEALNVVAPKAHALINLRSDSELQFRRSEQLLQELLAQWRFRHQRLEFHYETLSFRPPKPWRPIEQQLFDKLEQASRPWGLSLALSPSGGVCDGNLIAAEGIPTLDTLGVEGGGLHTEGEWLSLPSLSRRAQLAASLLFSVACEAMKESGWLS